MDICLTTNTAYASTELLEGYRDIQSNHREHYYLNQIDDALTLFHKFLAIQKENAIDKIVVDISASSNFNRFLKFTLLNFIINTMRITPMAINDERTIFVEVILQWLKYFGNITGLLLSFK